MGLGLVQGHSMQSDNARSRIQATCLLSRGSALPVSRMQVLAPTINCSRPQDKDLISSPHLLPLRKGPMNHWVQLEHHHLLQQGSSPQPRSPTCQETLRPTLLSKGPQPYHLGWVRARDLYSRNRAYITQLTVHVNMTLLFYYLHLSNLPTPEYFYIRYR